MKNETSIWKCGLTLKPRPRSSIGQDVTSRGAARPRKGISLTLTSLFHRQGK